MKCLVQRVSRAEVRVDGQVVGAIQRGALVLLGLERGDDANRVDWYARRIAAMKLFADEQGTPWVRTLGEVDGGVLVVSQFTLAARTRKGRRPSFDDALAPAEAEPLYRRFIAGLQAERLITAEGRFGALMEVELVNDGPVTFLLDGPA
ncbi:MAG: D-aminoacyl-tRNA deacylase [Acidobacteriota bacterium]